MSLNNVSSTSQGPSLLPGENLVTPGHTADIELRVPATIESGPKRTEYSKGGIWVSDQRVIFISDPSSGGRSSGYDAPPTLLSLSIPFTHLLSATFNLPLLSPNNILISFLPLDPDPTSPTAKAESLPHPGRGGKLEVKVIVGEGGGHLVWKVIEGEKERFLARRREEETLPVYTPRD